jgi:pantetheine-phosphate adenylyltransferase
VGINPDKVDNMKTIAIYPGSFNPFTVGHQNILEKAERIFGKDNVIIAVGINPDKVDNSTLEVIKDYDKDSKDEVFDRIKQAKINGIKNQISSKNIEGYIGFLTEYVREKESEGYNVVVVRGLRNGHDFDYEYNQIRFMWDQIPMLNIMCLFADPAYMHVSSSAYRALEKVKPGAGHKYLAREVSD